jgi:hypothetical protein
MTTRDAPDPTTGSLATGRDLPGEAESWAELHALIDRLTPETASVPGYFEEGWTAKDAVAHIGTWMAQGAQMLRRIAAGTYRDDDLDVDAANAEFLAAWAQLPEVTPEAAAWVRKAGPAHVDEHLPRLAGWLDELDARGRRTT